MVLRLVVCGITRRGQVIVFTIGVEHGLHLLFVPLQIKLADLLRGHVIQIADPCQEKDSRDRVRRVVDLLFGVGLVQNELLVSILVLEEQLLLCLVACVLFPVVGDEFDDFDEVDAVLAVFEHEFVVVVPDLVVLNGLNNECQLLVLLVTDAPVHDLANLPDVQSEHHFLNAVIQLWVDVVNNESSVSVQLDLLVTLSIVKGTITGLVALHHHLLVVKHLLVQNLSMRLLLWFIFHTIASLVSGKRINFRKKSACIIGYWVGSPDLASPYQVLPGQLFLFLLAWNNELSVGDVFSKGIADIFCKDFLLLFLLVALSDHLHDVVASG